MNLKQRHWVAFQALPGWSRIAQSNSLVMEVGISSLVVSSHSTPLAKTLGSRFA